MQIEDRLIRASDAKRAIEHADPAFVYIIDNVPTAERTHGHWIVEEDGNFRNVKCSACGKEYACHYGMLQLQNFDYCPSCGAQMNKE